MFRTKVEEHRRLTQHRGDPVSGGTLQSQLPHLDLDLHQLDLCDDLPSALLPGDEWSQLWPALASILSALLTFVCLAMLERVELSEGQVILPMWLQD